MSHDTLKNLPKGLLDAARMMIETTKPVETKTVQSFDEALVGNQHKIDANKNGKVDAHDFKLLRRKKAMKEALDSGVAVEDIVQFNSPMQPDLHEEIGVVVHRDRRDNTVHVVLEGKKYKLTKGQVKGVCEELLGELSKKTLASYVDKAAVDVHNKAYRAGKKEGQGAGYDLDNLVKGTTRMVGISKAAKKMAKEEAEIVEEVEQIDEISKETMLRYKGAAEADIASTKKPGKPSKAAVALRVKRGAGLENVKNKLEAIYKKEHQARRAEIDKANDSINKHFDDNHNAIFKKHGFNLVSQGSTDEHNVKTYMHAHPNGHATIVSVQSKKTPDDGGYGGSYKHEVRGVNTKGTSYSTHYPNKGVWSAKDVEQHKNEMLPKFESHLIRMKEEGASNNRW